MGTYTPTTWVNDTEPAINADNLNNIEAGIAAALRGENNLDDVADAPTARDNLGLGNAATADFGTGSGDVAEGDHTHTLADVSDAGDSAGLDVGTTAGTVAAGDHNHTRSALTPAPNLLTTNQASVETCQIVLSTNIANFSSATQTAYSGIWTPITHQMVRPDSVSLAHAQIQLSGSVSDVFYLDCAGIWEGQDGYWSNP